MQMGSTAPKAFLLDNYGDFARVTDTGIYCDVFGGGGILIAAPFGTWPKSRSGFAAWIAAEDTPN